MEKHSFPLQEEATEQTPHMDSASFQFLTLFAILAAALSSVKQGKQATSSENAVIEHFHLLLLSAAVQVKAVRRLQEQSAACCPSRPVWSTSTVQNI